MADLKLTITKLKRYEDARGLLFEPATAEEIAAQKNCHVVLSVPGCVRGNHYHHKAAEVMIVNGPMQMRFREQGQLIEHLVPAGETWKFFIPPGVSHAGKGLGPGTAFMMAFSSEMHDPAKPDLVRDLLFEV